MGFAVCEAFCGVVDVGREGLIACHVREGCREEKVTSSSDAS